MKLHPIYYILGITIVILAGVFIWWGGIHKPVNKIIQQSILAPYKGDIYHIFFHSLVVYPELAFKDDKIGKEYGKYMITTDEFKRILDSFYSNGFILVDIHSIYNVDEKGLVYKKELLLPRGKKPLIISLDDLNYYSAMKGRGFADKLVLDEKGEVATEVVDPQGKLSKTNNGDVVPILDNFVKAHPDFSLNGAKGTIAITGFEGILGYRTQASSTLSSAEREKEIQGAKAVVDQLKKTGWNFASHSYTHSSKFMNGTVSLDFLKNDNADWKQEVESITGPTDIFVGPFGQVFKEGDPRRDYLVSQGFRMLCGVGTDIYLKYFENHIAMDRMDIDGYRLGQKNSRIDKYFDWFTEFSSYQEPK